MRAGHAAPWRAFRLAGSAVGEARIELVVRGRAPRADDPVGDVRGELVLVRDASGDEREEALEESAGSRGGRLAGYRGRASSCRGAR